MNKKKKQKLLTILKAREDEQKPLNDLSYKISAEINRERED